MEIWWDLVSKWLRGERASPVPRGSCGCWKPPPVPRRTGRGGTPAPARRGTSTSSSRTPSPVWRIRHNWRDPLPPPDENSMGLVKPTSTFFFHYYSQFKTQAPFGKTKNNSITRLAFFVAATAKFTQPYKHIEVLFKLSLTSAQFSPKSSTSKVSISWLNYILLWVTTSLTHFYLKLVTDPEAASVSHSGSPQT